MELNLTEYIVEILKDTIYPITANQLQQYQLDKNSTLDFIIQLCQNYTQHLNMAQAQIMQNKYGTKTAKVTKAKHQYSWAQLNTYGARIIYLIRTLLTQEELSFLIGISNNNTTKQILISQQEMLKNLSPLANKKAIGIKIGALQQQMSKITDDEYLDNTLQRRNQWNKVEKLGTVERYNDIKESMIRKLAQREKDGHTIYKKLEPDENVWVKYSGKKHVRSYYYDYDGRDLFYNIGWLWQWYNAILRGPNDDLYTSVAIGLDNDSIAEIIKSESLENIAGTKQGDFQDAQNRQIQAKLNNEKIISYNNIKVILVELTQALLAWRDSNGSDVQQQQLQSVLQEHFFPDGALIGNETANKAFKDIMNTLSSTLKLT